MLIIGLIILLCGLLGGYANYHRFETNTSFQSFNLRKSLLTGLVASATVPLFLNMVSSNLLKEASESGGEYKYFIFAGFCLIAAFFSNRFLQSVSDRVIQDLQDKTRKIEEETTENKEKVEALIDKNVDEPNAADIDVENPIQKAEVLKEKAEDKDLNALLKSFSESNYSFRTINGLSKSTGLEISETKKLVKELENKEVLRMHKRKDGTSIYSITEIGKKIK